MTVIADVVAVNHKAKTVTLKGPKGNTVELKVEDPERSSAFTGAIKLKPSTRKLWRYRWTCCQEMKRRTRAGDDSDSANSTRRSTLSRRRMARRSDTPATAEPNSHTIISSMPVKNDQKTLAPALAERRLGDERHRESTAGRSCHRLRLVGLRLNAAARRRTHL